ncbi:MAG: IS21 family transposase, partial [Lentisphaerales bacterium]
MIDYATYCKIVELHQQHELKPSQIARMLSLDARTVLHWLEEGIYRQRQMERQASKLDPYKTRIVQWLETYNYTGVQILRMLREEGYEGGPTILKDYIAKIRPRKAKAYLTLHFAPGECAQVDWGEYGSVNVGNTRRRLSFFVMVLCYSRMLYVEFTVSETMEHFLGCHANAFEFFGGVPERVMVDNLRSAVLRHAMGQAPVFNPRYKDFADHFGF